jgi:hypothetical protein
MKPGFVLSLALMFALLVVVPVSAAPPVFQDGSWEGDWFWPAGTLCPGFAVKDHMQITYRQMTYLDNTGNVVRIQKHFSGIDNFSNADNPGIVLTGRTATLGGIDPNTLGDTYAKGLTFHITVPGYGTVLVAAGLWSQFPAVHIAGKDSFSNPEDLAQFCSALAGH